MGSIKNKYYISIGLIICLVIGGLPFIFDLGSENSTVQAATLTVNDDGGAMYTTIQAAVNAANSGDVIDVWPGYYLENVVINKDISVQGAGDTVTIIDGGTTGDVVHVTSDWVNVTGFNITNGGISGDGIEIYYSNNCRIENCTFFRTDYDIHLNHANYNKLLNNNCNDIYNSDRIFLTNSDFNVIKNNNCSDGGYGILIHTSDSNLIENNDCSYNYYGLHIYTNSPNNLVLNNKFNSCIYMGLSIYSAQSETLKNNAFKSCGIVLDGSSSTWNSHDIDTTNTVNSKPIYYWKNTNGGVVPGGAGQVILASCQNVVVKDQNIDDAGKSIQLGYSHYNKIINNSCSKNGRNGIHLYSSNNNLIDNNKCIYNKRYGVYLEGTQNNIIINNTCNLTTQYDGIYILGGSGHKIDNNTCESNDQYGIYQKQGSNNLYVNNSCFFNKGSALRFYDADSNIIKNNIFQNNNNEGIYVYTSDFLTIQDNNCSNNRYGISLSTSASNNIINNKCDSNSKYGILIKSNSFNNIIDNCSIISNTLDDIWVNDNSINNILVNSSFDIVNLTDLSSTLIIKNYLHISVNDSNNLPVQNVDIQVKDNNNIIYSTPGYGGSDQRTNSNGQVKWILVTDRIYDKNNTATENITNINVKHPNINFNKNNRNIEMAVSHFEYFNTNIKPSKINLITPLNNSYLNDSTPELKWYQGIDLDNDLLFYTIQIDELNDNWLDLAAEIFSPLSTSSWNLSSILIDGAYQWRICANDSIENGIWSDVWTFTIDTDKPIANKPIINCVFNNTGTLNWTWSPSADTGSGITGYYVSIGTIANGEDVKQDVWTPYTWYELNNLEDGKYYYCKIKAKNGAGIIGEFGVSSDGVLIDLDIPLANTPLVPGEYDITGTVNWTWIPSDDTGSGILGYRVCIGTSPDGNDVVSDEFVMNSWFEKSGLMHGNTYYCKIKVVNGAGTISEHSDNSNGIYIDLTIPTGVSIQINNDDEFTNNRLVLLKLTAEDTGSGLEYMSFSNDGTLWSAWEIFKDNIEYTFTIGDGLKTIYFKVNDLAGNVAPVVFDEITLDTKPPFLLSIYINNNDEITDSDIVTLNLYGVDNTSGIYQMALSTDGITWSDWEPFNSTKMYTLSGEDGLKYLYFKISDYAGNIASPVYDIITLDTSVSTDDTDGDGYIDENDAFPTDPTEWLDTDGDDIGNNADPDDDNDGLLDVDEDKNGNNIVDEDETDPLLWDTDGDSYNDKEDEYPLDSTKWEKDNGNGLPDGEEPENGDSDEDNTALYAGIGIAVIIIIVVLLFLFMFFIKKKGKGEEVPVEETQPPTPEEIPPEVPPEQPLTPEVTPEPSPLEQPPTPEIQPEKPPTSEATPTQVAPQVEPAPEPTPTPQVEEPHVPIPQVEHSPQPIATQPPQPTIKQPTIKSQ
jgi:parallel beta-helix repeat protein